jgi:multidrug resistance efflux pump
VASELQGYVGQVFAQAGNSVGAGQVLVVLDSSAVLSSVAQAQAALDTARADLELVRARPRTEEAAAKQAQVAMARAERNKVDVAYKAALEALREPRALQQQLLTAQAQAALAAQNVQLAAAAAAQARNDADQAEWNSSTRRALEFEATSKEAELEAARLDERAAQSALQHLQEMEKNPLSYRAKVHASEGAYRVAEAAVVVAEADLRDLLAGATAEELAAAQANVALAQAQLRLAQAQLERLTLRSPVTGTVTVRTTSVGETALPGVTLLTVADLETMTLTVYVPQTRLAEVYVGQAVDLTVDSFPERSFVGRVVHIADEAQYTPRNIATKEERVNTVYGVKIRLPNPQGLLKPGMAADARFSM